MQQDPRGDIQGGSTLLSHAQRTAASHGQRSLVDRAGLTSRAGRLLAAGAAPGHVNRGEASMAVDAQWFNTCKIFLPRARSIRL